MPYQESVESEDEFWEYHEWSQLPQCFFGCPVTAPFVGNRVVNL